MHFALHIAKVIENSIWI